MNLGEFNVKETKTEPEPQTDNLVGFGGWLIVFAIGMAYNLYRCANILYKHYLLVGTEEYLSIINPNSEYYISLWKPFITLEIAGNIIAILFIVAMAILCLRMSRFFKHASIAYVSFMLVLIVVEFFLMITLNDYYQDPIYYPEEIITPVVQAIIYASVWIPYMIVSKRVKNTFIR
ncbi:DUF2569 domain-containing protein [Paenibacillus agaridevorans]|uniref:DUF2569 domain-containing protein n=1 Tax=Paenibacillus agaridevorans TaxID=171404 RepID=UPI001BE4BD2B|nr:DUF2569 domain-containing protein [Paenibacillus agaridevorans]